MSVSTKPATFPWESSLLSHYLNTGVLDNNKQYHLTNFRKKKKKASEERLSLFLSGGKFKKKKKEAKVHDQGKIS